LIEKGIVKANVFASKIRLPEIKKQPNFLTYEEWIRILPFLESFLII